MSALLGGGGSATQKPVIYSGLQVSSSRMDLPVALFWGTRRLSPNAIWYNDFKKTAVKNGKGGGKGGGGKGGNQQYDYSAATILALCEGPIDGINLVWGAGSTTTPTTLAALNQTLFTGTNSQAPWSFAATNYPAQARAYAQTAYLASPKMDLGSAATIPDNAYECQRTLAFAYTHTTANGWKDPTSGTQYSAVDVLLSDCINDLLTNPQYGMNFSAGDIGSLTQYATYMRAQGLFFSPLLNSQTKCTQIIDRWAQLSNAWIYWAGTQLQFVPLGDSAITANGVTYTPDNAVAYNLSVANGDFIGDVPVKVSRVDPADCFNRTVVQITDRSLGYATNPIPYQDDGLVGLYGLRDSSSTQGDDCCDATVAAIIARLLCQRAANIRATYSFKAGFRYIRVLPGTILTLTDPNAGLNLTRVRVRTVARDPDGQLNFVAEEAPALVGTVGSIPASTLNVPTTPNQNIAPGAINTPAILEPDASFTNGVAQIIIAASGGLNWGGANVHISFDNTNYTTIGQISSSSIQGALTATLASHADPDTTNTLSVDCSQSRGVPIPVAHADADALRTLAYVVPQPTLTSGVYNFASPGELLAFGTVTTTGSYSANLTYLRRGKYGSAVAAHSSGDQFTVVNVLGSTGSSIAYALPPQYIGQPIWIKLTSFNAFGNAEEDISAVATYKYTPVGASYGLGSGGKPLTPTGATAIATAYGFNYVSWAANAAVDNVQIYRVYQGIGTSVAFGSCVLMWGGTGLSFNDAAIAVGVSYTYYVVAVNSIGASAQTSAINVTATSSGATSQTTSGTVTGTPNGVLLTFTCTPPPTGSTAILSMNGTVLSYGPDYTISNTTLTFAVAPPTGAAFVLSYAKLTANIGAGGTGSGGYAGSGGGGPIDYR